MSQFKAPLFKSQVQVKSQVFYFLAVLLSSHLCWRRRRTELFIHLCCKLRFLIIVHNTRTPTSVRSAFFRCTFFCFFVVFFFSSAVICFGHLHTQTADHHLVLSWITCWENLLDKCSKPICAARMKGNIWPLHRIVPPASQWLWRTWNPSWFRTSLHCRGGCSESWSESPCSSWVINMSHTVLYNLSYSCALALGPGLCFVTNSVCDFLSQSLEVQPERSGESPVGWAQDCTSAFFCHQCCFVGSLQPSVKQLRPESAPVESVGDDILPSSRVTVPSDGVQVFRGLVSHVSATVVLPLHQHLFLKLILFIILHSLFWMLLVSFCAVAKMQVYISLHFFLINET